MDSVFLNTKLEEFILKMKGDGYCKENLYEIYKRTNFNMINYCLNNDLDFNISNIDLFLNDYYGVSCSRYRMRKRAILSFINFINNGEYKIKNQCKDKIILNNYFVNINNEFYSYMISNDTTEITATKKIKINKLFLNWLKNNNINSIENITKDNVYNFLNTINNYSSEYQRKIRETMKLFLNWLHLYRKISFSGNNTIFKTKILHNTTIPSFYTIEEISNAINQVNKDTKIGKRDYLILLLLSHYGFRAGDLLNLKFDNLDFTNNRINIIQNKTNTPLSVPMFDEIKYAFLDYIKNSRPESEEKYIFVKYNPNHKKYKNVVIFGEVITKYFKLAGISIENKHHSSHSLRHSIATNMLLNNTPITSIEGILGHNRITSTEIYVQLDFNKLRDLCLEIPYEL